MADKAKTTASNLFAKTKTFTFRATQKAMVKLGKAEETVDIQFNQENERFQQHYKAVKKLKKDTRALVKILQDLAVQQAIIADDLHGLYDTKASNYNATLKNQDISKSVDQARIAFDENMKKDFLEPISKYLGQFKEATIRINERNTRLVDMDRYGRDVRSLQEKAINQAKVSAAQQKFEAATSNYHSLNDELLKDLPRLYDDRIPFFDPLLATYSLSLSEYYKSAARSTSEIHSPVSHIDRESVHNHQRVLTPTESSAFTFKSTIGTGSSNRTSAVYSSGFQEHDPYASEYSTASAPPSEPQPTAVMPPHRSALPTPPVKKLPQAKALFDFNPAEANELGFRLGDVLTIHSMKGDWWEGELNGRKGLLPSNYVQLL